MIKRVLESWSDLIIFAHKAAFLIALESRHRVLPRSPTHQASHSVVWIELQRPQELAQNYFAPEIVLLLLATGVFSSTGSITVSTGAKIKSPRFTDSTPKSLISDPPPSDVITEAPG